MSKIVYSLFPCDSNSIGSKNQFEKGPILTNVYCRDQFKKVPIFNVHLLWESRLCFLLIGGAVSNLIIITRDRSFWRSC